MAAERGTGEVSVALVVPVLNEAGSLDTFFERVQGVFSQDTSTRLQLVFVNDGSTDATLATLQKAQMRGLPIRIVDLSRNFGKEAALIAGFKAADADVVVPIDVDLQDPPEIVLGMIGKWREGFDVVLAHRKDRSADTWSKRVTASWFYKIHNRIADTKIPPNVGDFRLMDRAVIDAIKELPESRIFMKGLMAWAGFSATTVEYDRDARNAGESKFNSWKLWNFAIEGITSFSTAPLRIWTYLGFSVALLSFLYGGYIALRVLIFGADTPGFASIFVAVTFLGGLQLIGIGVIGEYLGRTYIEAKRRPAYIIRRVYDFPEGEQAQVSEADSK